MKLHSIKETRACEPEVIAAALEYAAIVGKDMAATAAERSRLTVILTTHNIAEADLLHIAARNTPAAA